MEALRVILFLGVAVAALWGTLWLYAGLMWLIYEVGVPWWLFLLIALLATRVAAYRLRPQFRFRDHPGNIRGAFGVLAGLGLLAALSLALFFVLALFFGLAMESQPAALAVLGLFVWAIQSQWLRRELIRFNPMQGPKDLESRKGEVVESLQADLVASSPLFSSEREPSCAAIDESLAEFIAGRLKQLDRPRPGGYVYIKRWSLPDGTAWYKIGATDDPRHKNAEENLLPVPVQTLELVPVLTMEQAEETELELHASLARFRISRANNSGLYALSDSQALAVRQALKWHPSRLA